MQNACFPTLENNLIPDIGHAHLFDKSLATKLDSRVLELINEAFQKTLKIITDNEAKYLEVTITRLFTLFTWLMCDWFSL